jgi:hypothetical protein
VSPGFQDHDIVATTRELRRDDRPACARAHDDDVGLQLLETLKALRVKDLACCAAVYLSFHRRSAILASYRAIHAWIVKVEGLERRKPKLAEQAGRGALFIQKAHDIEALRVGRGG